jgi:type VI secretion system protein ImpM
MAEFGAPGFFGKLPSRGDFVSRRLPAEFVSAWDGWLQEALAAAQARLGAQWLDVYLTSPVWCFALSAGTCGDAAYAGVFIPSVDKVGRYFPLVAAMPYTDIDSTLSVRRELGAWYGRAQELLLETLDEPSLELELFDERLAALTVTPATVVLDWQPPGPVRDAQPLGWQFVGSETLRSDALNAALLSRLLTRDFGAHSVWWTAGSDRVGPSALIVPGLPRPAAFTAMLDGNFDEREWTRGVLRRLAPPETSMRLQSAATSHPGKVREINEDSFACRDDIGVWIVADGLGGHQAGDVASRMVAAVAEQLPATATLEEAVAALVQSIQVVNRCLRVLAECDFEIAMAGSTVAALIVKETTAAVVWAGDSRVYRLRNRQVQQLTRDHADDDEMPSSFVTEIQPRAVTRAVGGMDDLELDVLYADVRAADRYLLCTDGLYTALSDDDLGRVLSSDRAAEACGELERLVLEGAATDNLTGVVVHIEAPETDLRNDGPHIDGR